VIHDAPSVAPPTDAVIVRRAALGDREAFELIFHRHAPAMFRYASNMLDGDVGEAEDAVQNALVKVWQHLPDFRGESKLRTWMFRITANEVLAARRRRPVAVDDRLLDSRAADRNQPERQVERAELWQALTLALSELPWRQRASWLLMEVEGMSYQEIARTLDTSVTVVRGQLHRARRTLAIRMAQWR